MMSSLNILIVQEYLESLKEDKELDALLPILITLMGFRVISTAKDSKGQPQYGKDLVAIGKNEKGFKCKYYFEIKGGKDRNITDHILNKSDGIIESLRAAKYTAFSDFSDANFEKLPTIYVLVHNGEVRRNARPTFEGFVKTEFPKGNFEHWEISRLTELFSKYLFNEYLLTDLRSLKLFKKTLILLDSPDYDFQDFRDLVDLQIEKASTSKTNRVLKKFFATLNLLANLIFHYSKEHDNLEPAKQCVTYLILRTWGWILKKKLENKPSVEKVFIQLLETHYQILEAYFEKTFSVAIQKNGLFSGADFFEEIGYPIRFFDYVNNLIYFFQLKSYFGKQSKNEKVQLKELIENNYDALRPLVDNHSIAIVNMFVFFLDTDEDEITADDLKFIRDFLGEIFMNISSTKRLRDRFPELYN